MAATNGKKTLAKSSDSIVVPSPLTNMNAQAFLLKTYDMVDDPANRRLVSWRPMNNGFIVKDEQEFATVILPKYFKHNNFSSFLRQLCCYGFKRVDHNRWEFENEGFVRGKRHLLQKTYGLISRDDEFVEFDKFVLKKEVEKLKRDNNVLMQELDNLSKQQQTTDTQLEEVVQRLDAMDLSQLEMMSMLLKDVDTPDFSAESGQKQNESSMLMSEGSKKRRFTPDVVPDDHPVSPDGQILSPDFDFVWDISSFDEILKSIDPSGGQFPVCSPLATDAEEMAYTPTAALQQISDAKPSENEGSKRLSFNTKELHIEFVGGQAW